VTSTQRRRRERQIGRGQQRGERDGAPFRSPLADPRAVRRKGTERDAIVRREACRGDRMRRDGNGMCG